MHRFPDFDKDVRRPFAVAEDCCDCAEFYAGCHARPANPPTRCRDYLRLPDVMPGTCGQVFPPPRMQGRKEPRLYRQAQTGEQGPVEPRTGARVCGCGASLSKGKRFCETCRVERRRQTKRGYMRGYMEQRRSTEIDVVSDVPFTHATGSPMPACGEERPSKGRLARGVHPERTSVLTEGVL
jgi:hypothetical protein